MKKFLCLYLLTSFFFSASLWAQHDQEAQAIKRKTGFGIGGVPAVAYDSDIGFLYGIILNLYHYGDGSRYPRYDHSLYMEWSRTTKGTGKNILQYDSDRLIPGIRTAAEISYYTEQALDFYGFNGYRAYYNADYTDDEHPDYLSRLFYKMDRNMLILRTDFSGNLSGDHLKWFAGITHRNFRMDSVDITTLNEGKDGAERLPGVGGGLFGRYAYDWGVIPEEEINGGSNTLLKLGVIYDTRDNEPNPMKGIWTEAQLHFSPAFLGNTSLSYTRLILTHRQYFTLVPRDLNFVYRLSYQGKLTGRMPYYMLPFYFNSPPSTTKDGLGGGKTMRGILRNRVAGEGYLLGNVELRWKFAYFTLFNQNFYTAASIFSDAGMVTQKYPVNTRNVPAEYMYLFPDEPEKPHFSAGAGFHIAWNENFIVAVDYGRALDKRDGISGLYILLDWLF